jgi:hypothetical protein
VRRSIKFSIDPLLIGHSHSDYRSQGSVNYKAKLPTSQGNLTVPQLQGHLTLHGRDSKVMVTDYKVGDFNLLYSSAEVFTWYITVDALQ